MWTTAVAGLCNSLAWSQVCQPSPKHSSLGWVSSHGTPGSSPTVFASSGVTSGRLFHILQLFPGQLSVQIRLCPQRKRDRQCATFALGSAPQNLEKSVSYFQPLGSNLLRHTCRPFVAHQCASAHRSSIAALGFPCVSNREEGRGSQLC